MHNFSTVLKFEIVRVLKKKSFWLMSLSFPVMIAAVIAVIYFSNQATNDAATTASKQKFSFVVTDNSGLVNPQLIKALDSSVAKSEASAVQAVKSGDLDAYFQYPKDLSKDSIKIYAKDVGLFDNGRYDAVAKMLLAQSVGNDITPNVKAILSDSVKTDTTAYKEGVVYDGFKQLIAPGIFLILFYVLITTFGSQMLSSTTEEKENRVIEMILTTIQARTLIVGKIFALIFLGFAQMLIIMAPVLVGYLLLHDRLDLPMIDLTDIPIDPLRIVIGAVIFSVSFILFTGILVGIGAATPTAKEANGFFGVVMMLIFGPLYAVTLFVSQPEATVVQFLSNFPFTAPIPLLLRNAVGNLTISEATIAIAVMSVTAVIVMWLAIRAFRYGALEYSRRLSISEIFRRKA